MANKKHLEVLEKGVPAWNEWRKENPSIWPDLAGMFRRGESLPSLGGADLSGANLSSADLRGTNLSGANLSETNFKNSVMTNTKFADVDLSTAKELETVEHTGPSTIGIDTVYMSKGKIPEVFLRGAGVPELFITYMRSLAANPIEFYSCFISYSTKDQQFAQRLYADLQNKNVRCWFAPHDMQSGRKVHEQIDQAERHCACDIDPFVGHDLARSRLPRGAEGRPEILYAVHLG
jgi:hypothetical protein